MIALWFSSLTKWSFRHNQFSEKEDIGLGKISRNFAQL
jgi:hypothetical protein